MCRTCYHAQRCQFTDVDWRGWPARWESRRVVLGVLFRQRRETAARCGSGPCRVQPQQGRRVAPVDAGHRKGTLPQRYREVGAPGLDVQAGIEPGHGGVHVNCACLVLVGQRLRLGDVGETTTVIMDGTAGRLQRSPRGSVAERVVQSSGPAAAMACATTAAWTRLFRRALALRPLPLAPSHASADQHQAQPEHA